MADRPTEPLASLTDADLAELKGATHPASTSRYDVLVRRLIAAEESRRRGAASMEEMARAFFDGPVYGGSYEESDVRAVASLLAQVRAQAMADAAAAVRGQIRLGGGDSAADYNGGIEASIAAIKAAAAGSGKI